MFVHDNWDKDNVNFLMHLDFDNFYHQYGQLVMLVSFASKTILYLLVACQCTCKIHRCIRGPLLSTFFVNLLHFYVL